MGYQTLAITLITIVFFALRQLNRTDVPRIKNLPEIRGGLPLFGNLLQLGNEHARRAAEWAIKYGPVFQARLGNRVSVISRRLHFRFAVDYLFWGLLETQLVTGDL